MKKEFFGGSRMKSALVFQAVLSLALIAAASWLLFAKPPQLPLSTTDVGIIVVLMAMFAWSFDWSRRRLRVDWSKEPLAIIDEEQGVWVRDCGYGRVAWNEIIGGRVIRYFHRSGAGWLLDIEVPAAVGTRCLRQAPWTWRPLSQWKSDNGYFLRVVSDQPREELEEGLRLILAWKKGA